MVKFQLKDFFTHIGNFFKQKLAPQASKLPDIFIVFISSWWRIILIIFAAIIFLYYPLGGLMVNNIDTDTSYEIQEDNLNQSSTADMMAFIINREVNNKLWTPNLPFFFPSYFLDNMPNFQLGMFDTLAKFSSGFANKASNTIVSTDDTQHLKEAANLLKYPGTVWMFSPNNKLLPAPSANTQYRKARKHYIKHNRALADGSQVWYKNSEDLVYFLKRANKDIWKSTTQKVEKTIIENSQDFFDNTADEIFYYNQGKIYAYYLIFKALGQDYKEVIVRNDIYSSWMSMLKAMQNAAEISPSIIRNGELSSMTAPNHLAALGYYMLKTQSLMNKIDNKLADNAPTRKN